MRLFERTEGEGAITSARIETITGWASHTVRKDISFLGAAGTVSSAGGYDPAALVSLIKKALDLEKRRKFCVVGLGRLGSAYLNAQDLEGSEFELAAGFDTNVNRTEILKSPAPLYPAYKMGEVISRFGIEIALLCVPVEAAQAATEKLVAAGIRGILNFAPAIITVPPGIAVRNVYLTDELRSLVVKMDI
jgi:redox-sensing transcriptional repressor